jgi:hypothetical protein
VYFIFFFIYLLSSSPIPGAVNADHIASIRKPHGQYAPADRTDTVEPVFLTTVAPVLDDDTPGIKKRLLSDQEGDVVLGLILLVFTVAPFKMRLLHPYTVSELQPKKPYHYMAFLYGLVHVELTKSCSAAAYTKESDRLPRRAGQQRLEPGWEYCWLGTMALDKCPCNPSPLPRRGPLHVLPP